MMVRKNCVNTLHRCDRLFQEYICDQDCKIEGARMRFYKNNQDTLRVDLYSGLQEALSFQPSQRNSSGYIATQNNSSGSIANQSQQGPEAERLGQMVVLPASHTGSPRYMYKHYLDALAICREYRKFDLFITITCNPKWDAIKENIFFWPSTSPEARHCQSGFQ